MPLIIVIYHSQQYGNTKPMAEAVAEGARQAGAEVELFNTNETRVDVEAYRRADGAAFGSPDYYSYIAGGMKMFLDDWYIAKQSSADGLTDKPYGLFLSHGGGGRVRESLESLCSRMGGKIGTTVESRGAPNDSVLAECRALGAAIAGAAAAGA